MHNIKQNLGRVFFMDDLYVASWYWLLLKVILDFPPIYGYEETIVDGIYHGLFYIILHIVTEQLKFKMRLS